MLVALIIALPVGYVSGLVANFTFKKLQMSLIAYLSGLGAGMAATILVCMCFAAALVGEDGIRGIIKFGVMGSVAGPLIAYYSWRNLPKTVKPVRQGRPWASKALVASASKFIASVTLISVRRALLITGGLVAVVGFLCVHGYAAQNGLIWNIMRDQIYLTDPCSDADVGGFTVIYRPGFCGNAVAYKWVLAIAFVLAGFGLLLPSRRVTCRPLDETQR